jgi:hypothetical protein
VTLVGSHLPKDGRKPGLDLAEIDFANKRISVVDTSRPPTASIWTRPAFNDPPLGGHLV